MKFMFRWIIPITFFAIANMVMGDMVIWEKFIVMIMFMIGFLSNAFSHTMD